MPDNQQIISIRASRKEVTTITLNQLMDIFTIYPDEPLLERAFFQKAQEKSSLTINEIKSECDKLNIPWQLFLLEPGKLNSTIQALKQKRRAKFNERQITNRDGNGRGVSLRIADRVIALQEYAKANIDTDNDYCGSLNGKPQAEWVDYILDYFEIDQDRLKGKSKASTLDYLIEKLEAKNIRVARGVLSNKIMPSASEITSTYKKSSGFIVHDDQLPYVFLPNEVSEATETAGRQILTLLSLVILLGKGEHNVFVNGDLEVQYQSKQILRQAFEVAGEILFPVSASDELRGTQITPEKRDELAAEYMLTPSALVVTLRRRDVIESDDAMQELLESISYVSGKANFARTPKMETSVKKFCGNKTASEIISDITNGKLTSIPAQYLLFGHIDKKHFAKFKSGLGL